MPRDACGDRLPERFLDVGAATLRVTRCFQFSQVVLLQSCRTTPRCYDPHPQPQIGMFCASPASRIRNPHIAPIRQGDCG
jgi:hypothetical protein